MLGLGHWEKMSFNSTIGGLNDIFCWGYVGPGLAGSQENKKKAGWWCCPAAKNSRYLTYYLSRSSSAVLNSAIIRRSTFSSRSMDAIASPRINRSTTQSAILMQRRMEECGENYTLILFFYSNEESYKDASEKCKNKINARTIDPIVWNLLKKQREQKKIEDYKSGLE